jgi:anti-sigma B factor antagonist
MIVSVRGELDVRTSPELRAMLIELIGAGSRRFVIDLDPVEYLDSTGLGALVGGMRRIAAEGGDLKILCSTPRTLRILEITGVSRILEVVPSESEAVEALRPE